MAPLMPKQEKWLRRIDQMTTSNGSSMYSGEPCDLVPAKISAMLERRGLISISIPSNQSHKERWIITKQGRDALRTV